MTLDTLRHIESLQRTAVALEDHAHKVGYYSRDCKSLDAAIARGRKSGFAMLFDEHGEPEVIPLGNQAGEVEVTKGKEPGSYSVTYGESGFETWKNEPRREKEHAPQIEMTPAYAQINEHSFPAMAAKSHEPGSKSKFPPQVHEGPARSLAKGPTRPTGDAARRAAMTADARKFAQAQYSRNERIAQQMKERSAQIHR